MIDKEYEVFDRCVEAVLKVRTDLTENNFSSDYVDAPSDFPHVSIIQTESTTATAYQDYRFIENKVMLTYEVSVYSNLESGKREECKNILKIIDDTLFRMNMTRQTMAFVPNLMNNSIARLVARYQVIADEERFYRR